MRNDSASAVDVGGSSLMVQRRKGGMAWHCWKGRLELTGRGRDDIVFVSLSAPLRTHTQLFFVLF